MNKRPLCPACKTATVLARATPGPIGFDIQTFECLACHEVHQTVADLLTDPMKSVRTNTWLRGQLRAPT
jgi:hypothetical protein